MEFHFLCALLSSCGPGGGRPSKVSKSQIERDGFDSRAAWSREYAITIEGMQPSTADDWGAIRSSLEMWWAPRGAGGRARRLPAHPIRDDHPMECKWKDSVYAKYSDIMREIAMRLARVRFAAGVPATRRRRGRAGVLDINKMMNCTFERPGKRPRGGWTRDGYILGLEARRYDCARSDFSLCADTRLLPEARALGRCFIKGMRWKVGVRSCHLG